MKGCVFQIQRFTVHDGPGIRTEVFLKGCPLRCPWCSNPESQSPHLEPGIYPSRCLGASACGLCEQAARRSGAVRFDDAGVVSSIDRGFVSLEDAAWVRAVDACPTEALKMWGAYMELDQVMEAIERDRRYYETSGGGMTVSGGEPLVQAEFTCALLERCRQVGIRTCLESTLHARWDVVERALAHADLLIADFKCADSAKHARVTGVPNDTIVENLVRAADRTDQIIVRIPVIPGFNEGDADCAAAADFLERNLLGRIREVQLLEFMRMGEEKCHSLERSYPMKDRAFDRDDLHSRVLAFQSLLQSRGFACTLGGGKGQRRPAPNHAS